jgi:hypothetical protein
MVSSDTESPNMEPHNQIACPLCERTFRLAGTHRAHAQLSVRWKSRSRGDRPSAGTASSWACARFRLPQEYRQRKFLLDNRKVAVFNFSV